MSTPIDHSDTTAVRDGRTLLETATTFLFVPGDRPGRFEKALRSDADVVIIDWEASVIGSRKETACQNTISFLKQADGRKVAIRLNPYSSRDFLDDAAAVWALHKSIAGAFLTMVSSGDEVSSAAKAFATAQESSPVVIVIDPKDCSFQFNPTGTASFNSGCDVARRVLSSNSASYATVHQRGPLPT